MVEPAVDAGQDVSQWSGHDIHDRIIAPSSKEEKISLYAIWASDYDKYCRDTGYEGPAIAFKRFYPYISSSPSVRAGAQAPRLLDCGCGTGRLSDHIKQMPFKHPLYLIGIDYCKEMLDEARKREVYQCLLQADLSQLFELPGGQVDFLVAAGLFLDGHCGPEVMPNMFKHLKAGGHAVMTVRNSSFVADENEYLKWIDKSQCDILENTVASYIKGEVDANYIILRKRS